MVEKKMLGILGSNWEEIPPQTNVKADAWFPLLNTATVVYFLQCWASRSICIQLTYNMKRKWTSYNNSIRELCFSKNCFWSSECLKLVFELFSNLGQFYIHMYIQISINLLCQKSHLKGQLKSEIFKEILSFIYNKWIIIFSEKRSQW